MTAKPIDRNVPAAGRAMEQAFAALDEAFETLPAEQAQELCAAVLARFAIGTAALPD